MRIDAQALPDRYKRQILDIYQKESKRKYHNVETHIDGIHFDSKKEAERFAELKIMRDAGEILNLKLQHQFTLIEGFKTVEGESVKPVRYLADFTYYTKDGKFIIEDVKGIRTKEYILKKKMMADKGFYITEV